MSYGTNFPQLSTQTADLANRVLRGESPANIPVQWPKKFDLTINLTTAKKLKLNINPNFVALADVIIE